MNKNLLFVIIGCVLSGLIIAFMPPYPQPKCTPHRCYDSTHELCDGNCECDGLGCGIAVNNQYQEAVQYVNACDYQLELVEDSILVFDGKRYVGTIPMWDNSPLDSLLQKDNE